MIPDPNKPAESSAPSPDLRLDSWKEIAAYLKRDIRTVQLWEKKEALPVHRHTHAARSTVHAYTAEIDAWQKSRRARTEETPASPQASAIAAPLPARRVRLAALLAGALFVLVLLAAVAAYSWRASWGSTFVYWHPTIAVLPFEDLSANPAETYLADGLTDDLITALGRSGQLQLISRTSVMRFKGRHESLPRIARELRADLVLEGSVLYAGKRARITAQLIDAATDKHIWADSYERDFDNVIALQDDIADQVAAAVSQKLTGRAPFQPAVLKPGDPEVRRIYLLGRFYQAKRNQPGLKQAIIYYQQALAKDPGYAPAYAGLADCYNLLSVWGSLSSRDAFSKAKQNAQQALRLDPSSAEAYTSLAFATYRNDWDFARAEQYFHKAIELNPNYAAAHQWYGEFLGDLKRAGQSIAESRKAQELDPLSAIIGCDLADSYLHAGRYADAVSELKRVLAMDSDFVPAHAYLAGVYAVTGQTAMAEEEEDTYIRLSGDNDAFEMQRIRRMFESGKLAEARRSAEALLRNPAQGHSSPYFMAHVYVSIGDTEKAFQSLEKAYQERSWWLVSMLVDPELAPLRTDRRFLDLARRVGLTM